jgi:hypothetical protein
VVRCIDACVPQNTADASPTYQPVECICTCCISAATKHVSIADVLKSNHRDSETTAALQIVSEQVAPVASANVADVWFPPSSSAIIASAPDDYIVRYTAFLCRKRETDVKLLLCSSDEVVAHVDGKQVRCAGCVTSVAQRDGMRVCC